jgi:hypothetical protein
VVAKVAALHLASAGNSGILGLSFPSESAIPSTVGTSFLANLLSTFPAEQSSGRGPFFAFKLSPNRVGFGQVSTPIASLTLGSLDEDVVGPSGLDGKGFVYSNVSSAGTSHNAKYNYWKLPLRSMTIDTIPFTLSPSLVPGSESRTPIAVLDTGTTLILGPTQDVREFWEAVGNARWNEERTMWEVRCERGVKVGLVLGDGADGGNEGKEYFLNPADVNWKEGGSNDGWCMGGIQPNDRVCPEVVLSSMHDSPPSRRSTRAIGSSETSSSAYVSHSLPNIPLTHFSPRMSM